MITRERDSPATSAFFGLLVLLIVLPPAVLAGGFRVIDQGASATGQASAFIAQADDPSAIYYNPAGITQLRGIQLYTGTTLIGGQIHYTSPTGISARGDLGGTTASPPPSQIYLTANLKDLGIQALRNLSIGLGVVGPFGTNVRWPDDGPFSTAITRAALEIIDVKPTLAYKINDDLSVGLGADVYTFSNLWGEGHAEQKFNMSTRLNPLLPPGVTVPSELNGRDTVAGFNASALYTLLRNSGGDPFVNLAFQYRSQAVMNLKGQFLVNGMVAADTAINLVLPQVFTGGIALWPVRNKERAWKVEADLDITGWKSFRNTDVRLSNGMTIPFQQNWRNSYMTMIGTEYRWRTLPTLPKWEVALRAGYWYSQTAVPDASFSPSVPDADQHALSIGLGFLCKGGGYLLGVVSCGTAGNGSLQPKAIGLDLAYQAILYETRTVNGNQNPLAFPSDAVDGTYRTTLHVGAINLKVTF